MRVFQKLNPHEINELQIEFSPKIALFNGPIQQRTLRNRGTLNLQPPDAEPHVRWCCRGLADLPLTLMPIYYVRLRIAIFNEINNDATTFTGA